MRIERDRRVDEQRHHERDRHHEDEIARQVGDPARDPDAARIQDCLRDRDERDERRLVPPGQAVRADAEHRRDQRLEERIVGAEIDRGDHEDQAEQVEPCRHPPPFLPAEDRAPVIEAAGRRKRGRDLRHRHRDDQREQRAQRPAEADRGAAGGGKRELERGDAARQDADHGKRHREVRETAHTSRQFLRIAHLVQQAYVTVGA